MRENPRGYYIYAFLDGDTPFYIGKGLGNRIWSHFWISSRKRNSFFYHKFNKMLREDNPPKPIIIHEELEDEKLAYAIESNLITLVGTKLGGTGPLYNHPDARNGPWRPPEKSVTCWSENFPNRRAIARDPRCTVSHVEFYRRLHLGLSPEEAATSSRVYSHKPLRCWGVDFGTYAAVSRDDRCIVSEDVLWKRIKREWDIERAAMTPLVPKSKLKPLKNSI